MKTDKLLFGAAYYSEYLPYDRVDEDMAMMERAGMNTIRIAESTWSTLEPQDDVFDFTHIDQMLDAAARHHISVIVGTPTYAIPAWLMRKYPDILAITHDGPGLYGHRQNMDITHPGYRAHCERVIRTLMEHVKDVPHVIGYQLDNETKSYDTAGPRVQEMFVEYLKKKYPDIAEFNHEFGLDYWSNRVNDWADFPDIRGTINQSLAAEFKKFQRSLVTDFLSWQADIVREYARDDQFITQNFDFAWTTYSYGYQPEVNQYDASRCMTVAGADIYHPSQGNLTGAEITCCGNISRSLKADNYLILETEAQGNIEWLPYPGQLRLQAYSHIANGANSVMYWHWHSIHNAIESYWKGVLSHDFSENETYREACRIGAEWQRIGTHLKNIQKKNNVAILLDNNSLTGLAQFPLETAGVNSYNTVMRWLADSLYRLGVEYDMIPSSAAATCETAITTDADAHNAARGTKAPLWDLAAYDYVIVPALYAASQDVLRGLTSYVKNGGHLITTFRTAFSDEQLKIYADMQPHILHECLGLHYDQYTYPKDVTVSTAEPGLASGAREWMDMVVCDTATPVAHYCHPAWNRYTAVAKNQYGKGSTLYFATMFGEKLLDSILKNYLTETGYAFLSDNAPTFPVVVKHGINDFGRELFYYFNYSDKPQTLQHLGGNGMELLKEQSVKQGETLTLAAWDLSIVEV